VPFNKFDVAAYKSLQVLSLILSNQLNNFGARYKINIILESLSIGARASKLFYNVSAG